MLKTAPIDNLRVEVVGDTPQGLYVGDHRNGYEPLPMSLVVPDIHFLGNPFAPQVKEMRELGIGDVIPIIPQNYARDNFKLDSVAHRRLLNFKHLMTKEELRAFNRASLAQALETLGDESVAIFPHGKVADAARSPWFTGVGQLAEGRPDSLIIPFRFDSFSRREAMYRKRPVNLVLLTGKPLEARDFISFTPRQTTENIKEHYLESFKEEL